eukprot:s1_g2532.t1
MTAGTIASIVQIALLAWMAVLAASIFFRAFFGPGAIGGLLGRTADGSIEVERLQHVVVVLGGAFAYVAYALNEAAAVDGGLTALPDPGPLFEIYLASSTLYVGGKLSRTLTEKGDGA